MKIPTLYDILGNRIETMINGLSGEGDVDASTSLRLKMINWGLEWFQEKPWMGYGLNAYKTLLGTKNTSFGTAGVYAHNNYIELMVDIGIIGVIIYYYIYVYMIGKSFRNIKNRNAALIFAFGILIACIINEYGHVVYYDKFEQLLLILIYIIIENEDKVNKIDKRGKDGRDN
jgi:O-antigen ligase